MNLPDWRRLMSQRQRANRLISRTIFRIWRFVRYAIRLFDLMFSRQGYAR